MHGDQFLLPVRRRPHQHQEALLLIGVVFQADVDVNAVGPDVDVLLVRADRAASSRRTPAHHASFSRTITFALSPFARSTDQGLQGLAEVARRNRP